MAEKLLEVNNLKKYFKTKHGMLHAVDDLSFYINRGETLGLVGESGCGKSTTGRVILRLHEPTSGEVLFHGQDVTKFTPEEMKHARKKMQIVFQDPYSSLDPRLSVSEIIAEPLYTNKVYKTREETEQRIIEAMTTVGLEERLINFYPHELDGGRRQRIGIARAIAMNPEFIVMDEPVSALDVCIQAQIMNLMNKLQDEMGLTYLFISHNLSVVKHVSDRIAVMYLGKIVELTDYSTIFREPLHPYTQALISAIPIPKVDVKRERIILEGDVPSPVNPPAGCRFYSRCKYRKDICKEQMPELKDMGSGHYVACHLCDRQ